MKLSDKIKIILICVIVTSIASITTAYAAASYLYNADEVTYDKTNSELTSTNVQGAIDELYTQATNYTSLTNRVSTLETDLSTLSGKFKRGTLVVTFGSDGYASVQFSTLGVSSRPDYMVITPQYRGYVLLTYMYDSSSSEVKIYAYNTSSKAVYSGAMRFSYIIYVA